MRIAVTGATGFVGTHLVRALVTRGECVVAVVRETLPRDLPDGVEAVAMDLAAPGEDAWERLGRPEALVHLAWGGLPNYLSLHHFERELPLHYAFLRTLIGQGLPAVMVTGTCYEYGMADGPLSEDRDPLPANPYAFAKVALWRQLSFLKQSTRFSLTWARLFYMWGEGQAASSLYPLFRAALARGDEVFPMSGGEQLRDYLPVATVAGMLADLAIGGRDAGIVNICSGQPVSVRTLVERWRAANGSSIALDLGRYSYPTYEPLAFWGDPSKVTSLLAGSGVDAPAH